MASLITPPHGRAALGHVLSAAGLRGLLPAHPLDAARTAAQWRLRGALHQADLVAAAASCTPPAPRPAPKCARRAAPRGATPCRTRTQAK